MDKVNIPQTSYYRDLNSKAILNTDKIGRDRYFTQREIALKQKNEQEEKNSRIDTLEKDMSEIKEMLNVILRKVNGC